MLSFLHRLLEGFSVSALSDFLNAELITAASRKRDLGERMMFLEREYGNWTYRMGRFYARDEQPFGGPHPEFGPMTAFDFQSVLSMIDKMRRELRRAA